MTEFGRRTKEAMRNLRRRASDRRESERRLHTRRKEDRLRTATWDEQRTQFVTRYLFGALGLAYFNFGEAVAGSGNALVLMNVICVAYLALTTAYMAHAWWQVASPWRLRLAMWTDVLGVSAAVFIDSNVMSPAYLIYVVITLGNGMRYGVRAFAEAAVASFAAAAVVLSLRATDSIDKLSVTSLFFIMFVAIIVLYSYSLMKNIERARQSLEIASHNDVLTGLLNRRGLHERTEILFRSATDQHAPLAVLFADLDGFKSVNDVHGHDAGDRLLQNVARALAAQVRGSDIVARFGGDEFVVILPDTKVDHATLVAKRLQNSVAAVADPETGVSVTIGIAFAPEHGADLDSLLKSVDVAMYEGKQIGGRGKIRRADGVAIA